MDGAIAGAAGSHAIGLFFAATQRWAPKEDVDFEPPEQAQKNEQPTETVARRFVEGFAKSGPISQETKAKAGEMVHYAFGAAWGALYGAFADTMPSLCTPVGAALFGTKVWALSHGLFLPLFNLEAPPTKYSAGHHAYAIAGHLVYGATVMATYRALSSPLLRPALLASAAILYLMRLPRDETLGKPTRGEPIFEEPIETFAETDPSVRPPL